MPSQRDFTTEDVDAAIQFVIVNAAEDRALTVNYSRVFDAAGLRPPQDLYLDGDSQLVTRFMESFHHRCRERGLPPLDSLVVNVAGSRVNKPGIGYFRVNGLTDPFGERATAEQQVVAGNFWDAQVKECRQWGIRSRRGQL